MSWKFLKTGRISHERALQIINNPVITEKGTLASANNQVLLDVQADADKREIKQAVELLFKVQVSAVNSLVRKGKKRRFRNVKGQLSDRKLAYVTLAEGQSIDFEAGVQA